MNIAIIGSGHVGLVTGVVFAEKGHSVVCVDNDINKIAILRSNKSPIYEPQLEELMIKNVNSGRLIFSEKISGNIERSDVIFICVGTPPLPDGSPDLSFVEAVSREIAKSMSSYKVIAEKSTVPVMTGAKVKTTIERNIKQGVEFDVVSNPEFLSEGNAIQDAMNPSRIVIGVESKRAEKIMRDLYSGFNSKIIVTDLKSAELIKHASNSFLAMKISFINAVANICELAGANVEDVAKAMGLDDRIGEKFLRAGVGYGGSCFPKDLEAFIDISKQLGYNFDLLKEVQKINQQQRENFIKKIRDELWILKGKKICIWGLSFKPDTDDIREAPAIFIIEKLIQEGADIKVFDPKAMPKVKEIFSNKLTYEEEPLAAARDCDCLAILTEWEVFKNIDLRKLKEVMAQPVVIDGRNIFPVKLMRDLGFIYKSIGRV